ncbi:SICA antigen [Plasmodium coatneyi]|uniref:SICA antigen n=1 Tax=Plasmodium coatneyi TaxID=208452 RepID=A0A1B1E6L2_9APIC|nr:SICA antigen [Plasmodium coatneyi]ANQ10672.1 SICA antigen [Plasmodium coatneyi]
MVKMAPQKTSEFEQDYTKVEEEPGEPGARGGRPPRSAEAEPNNENKRAPRRRRGFSVIKLGPTGMSVTHEGNEGYSYDYDYLYTFTCKDNTLQTRLKEVIENWHTDKQNPRKDWDQVWKEIEDRIQPLSEYISKNKESMESHCKNPNGQDRTWTEADSNACMLITAGLRYIYGIKKQETETEPSRTNNRTFKATAACIILNEFIKKLEKKANSCTQKISIDKGITQAFSVSEEIKNSVCKGDSGCFKCKQWDYSKCTVNNDRVGEKLKQKFDSDEKIKEALEDIYPSSNLSSTSTLGSATIREWFKLFSNDVSSDDEKQYEELGVLSALCEHSEDDVSTDNWDRGKYGKFCEIMVKNIILTTAVPKKYKNQREKTPCEKKVKNIPVCDLLKVWMWYMDLFCAPKAVIERALEAVKVVRTDMNPGENYVKCTYEDALNLPYTGQTKTPGDPYYIFETSELHTMMKETTKEKGWCREGKGRFGHKTSEVPDHTRKDTEEHDQITNGHDNLNKMKKILQKVMDEVKEEVKKEGVKEEKEAEVQGEEEEEDEEEDLPSEEDPPGEEEEEDEEESGVDVEEEEDEVEEIEEQEASKEEPTSGDGTEQTEDPGKVTTSS